MLSGRQNEVHIETQDPLRVGIFTLLSWSPGLSLHIGGLDVSVSLVLTTLGL